LTAALLLVGCGTQPGGMPGASPLVRAQAGAQVAGVQKVGEVPATVEEAIKQALPMLREFHKLLTLKIVAAKGVTTPGGEVEVIYFFSGSFKALNSGSMFWPQYYTVHFEGEMRGDRIQVRAVDKPKPDVIKRIGEVPADVEQAIVGSIRAVPRFMSLRSLEIRAGKGVLTPGGKPETIYTFKGAFEAEKDSGFLPIYTRRCEGSWKAGKVSLELSKEVT
jgi:hypothetical protein